MAVVRKHRGRWVADFRDQNRRRRMEVPEGLFETKAMEKRAAEELLHRRVGEVNSHAYTPDRQRLTFAQVAKLWISSKVRLRASSRSDYLITLECYLVPYFGARKYVIISSLDIEKLRSEMEEGVPKSVQLARETKLRELKERDSGARLRALDPGPRTTNKCLGVMMSIGVYACRHKLAPTNPAHGIEKLSVEEDGESRVIEENVLTPGELVRAINAADDPFRMPIALSAYCGLREAEVLWLQLPPPLLAELKRWRLRCPKSEHDLVCPSVRGLPMRASALLQRGFHPALRRAGIRRIRFHDLRHSWASNLLEAGVDIITVF